MLKNKTKLPFEELTWLHGDKIKQLANRYPDLEFELNHWRLRVVGDSDSLFTFLAKEIPENSLNFVVDRPYFEVMDDKKAVSWCVYPN